MTAPGHANGKPPGATGRPAALVTGASAGLGEEFARQLAAAGHDLVLVARSGDRLDALAGELGSRHGVAVEVLVADLSDPAQLHSVETRVRVGSPLHTVVNNAGFGSFGRFWELPVASEVGQVEVNVRAVVALSHAALATMVPRGSGRLLNVSSTAGFAPGVGSATYGATKAFVTSFSEALHEETLRTGVHVTVLCPGFTRTGFQARAHVSTEGLPSFAWADPAAVVAAGLAALDRNEAVCVPRWVNKLVATAPRVAPRGLVRKVSAQVMRRL